MHANQKVCQLRHNGMLPRETYAYPGAYALYWGLAVNGAAGVHGMLELLRQELDQVMGYCGQTDVQHLEPGLVTVPYGWGNGTMYP
jgi:hypothetical protein